MHGTLTEAQRERYQGALVHGRERGALGQSLVDVQANLAGMASALEAARHLVRAAFLQDRGLSYRREAAIAKSTPPRP